MALWCVRVRYATKIAPGILDVTYDVDDLADVAVLIKQGPDRSFLYSHIQRGDDVRFPVIPIEGGDALPDDIVSKLERLNQEEPLDEKVEADTRPTRHLDGQLHD